MLTTYLLEIKPGMGCQGKGSPSSFAMSSEQGDAINDEGPIALSSECALSPVFLCPPADWNDSECKFRRWESGQWLMISVPSEE